MFLTLRTFLSTFAIQFAYILATDWDGWLFESIYFGVLWVGLIGIISLERYIKYRIFKARLDNELDKAYKEQKDKIKL